VTYPSCCTADRSVHDPQRQHTRISPARHGTGAGTPQHQPGMPGVLDLSHAVLPPRNERGIIDWRKLYLAYGPDGLHPRRLGLRRGRPPLLSVQAERAILALALAWPTCGPAQLDDQLRRREHGGLRLALSTIYGLLRRRGLQTRWE
jgi:hypothetical protein